MAAGQLSLTRRALLAGACAGPTLGRHSGLDPESSFSPLAASEGRWMPDQVRHDEIGRAKWDAGMTLYRRAAAGLEAVAHTEDDALYDRALGRFNAALKRLLRVPAPDLGALAMKLDMILDQELWELTGADRCLEALRRDVHRFAASAA